MINDKTKKIYVQPCIISDIVSNVFLINQEKKDIHEKIVNRLNKKIRIFFLIFASIIFSSFSNITKEIFPIFGNS